MKFLFTLMPAVLLSALLSSCATYVNISVVQDIPSSVKKVMKGKRAIGVVTVEKEQAVTNQLGFDWQKIVQGSVTDALSEYGYYNIVDLSSRKERLGEIAYSQTGLTQNMLTVGKESEIDALLFVDMFGQPATECRIEKKMSAASAAVTAASAAIVLYRASQGKRTEGFGSGASDVMQPTGVRNMTIPVRGRLVNIETGLAHTHTNKESFQKEANPGDTNCPSMLEAFEGAVHIAGSNLAKNLSPRVMQIRVPLEESVRELEGDMRSRVRRHLMGGIKWAKGKPPNYERATAAWEKALEESDHSSASAYWNLAVSRWQSGDMDGADEYFRRAEELGGPDWIDNDKMTIISSFAEEKKRLEKER